MSISGVGYSNVNNQLVVDKAMENYQKYLEKTEESTSSTTLNEGYEKSEETISTDSGIYSRESIMKTVEQIEEQRQTALSTMISEMLGQQAQSTGLDFIFGTGTSSLDISSITQADINDAQSSIEGDGYWSVNSVATRIMDMAELLANGDSSKLATLKDAVIKGFGGAISQFGYDSIDQMPDITHQTYTEVMNRFEKWEADFGSDE